MMADGKQLATTTKTLSVCHRVMRAEQTMLMSNVSDKLAKQKNLILDSTL